MKKIKIAAVVGSLRKAFPEPSAGRRQPQLFAVTSLYLKYSIIRIYLL